MNTLFAWAACAGAATTPRPEAVAGAGSDRFAAWIREVTARGFTPHEVVCYRGGSVPAWTENPAWTAPITDCTVAADLPGKREVVRLSEIAWADPADATAALAPLLARGDGGDPTDSCGGCKALVTGWVDGARLYWVTTRAAGWEADGCSAIAAFGSQHREGMFRCP